MRLRTLEESIRAVGIDDFFEHESLKGIWQPAILANIVGNILYLEQFEEGIAGNKEHSLEKTNKGHREA